MRTIAIYLAAVNILAWMLYGIDKWKAVHHKWRIRESVLIGIACIGGSVGALIGMQTFRHKTKHKKFTVGVPVILTAQIIAAAAACYMRL